jgi:hypothetical protein
MRGGEGGGTRTRHYRGHVAMGSLWLGQMADDCSGFVLFCVGSVTNNAEGPPPTGAGQRSGDYMQLGTKLTAGGGCAPPVNFKKKY